MGNRLELAVGLKRASIVNRLTFPTPRACMESYANLISEDVLRSEDISTWPPATVQLAQSIRDAFKVPTWLKSELPPYMDKQAFRLLDQLRTIDDESMRHLWADIDTVDDNSHRRLRFAFATALSDCARIQVAAATEELSEAPVPKESFVVVLVRNAILNVISGLSSLEDVLVALPRHFSGEPLPVLKCTTKHPNAPLVISICAKMSVEEEENDGSGQSEQEESSDECWPVLIPQSVTMSEFLATPTIVEEVEEEVEDDPEVLSPQFEAHFLAYPPSSPLPSTCHIPVLCMATEKYLPVVMTSLLYQRRVWCIDDPLIGIVFSKYDTIIRLYVGWLDEEDDSSPRSLPRVHLGSIETSATLDLSSPLVSLAVSQLFMSLESPICGLRDGVRNVVGTIAAETQTRTARPWRIDSDVWEEDAVFPSKMKNIRDRIIKWQESQKYSEDVPPRTSSPAAVQPAQEGPSIPEITRPDEGEDTASPPASEMFDTNPTLLSQMSCSRVADTSKANDDGIFSWLLDRKVLPQSLAFDPKFFHEYIAMTGFIWPMTWNVREDLPPVDAALEPCIQDLLASVAILKSRNAVKLFHPDEFPFDLRILEQSFSAIFQAPRRSREKKVIGDEYEVSWRHDHDRLLFDFFIRLVQVDAGTLLGGDKPIAHPEDLRVRPTLETTLRFPKSELLQRAPREFEKLMFQLLNFDPDTTRKWLDSRASASDASAEADREIESASYVYRRLSDWVIQKAGEEESETIARLGMSPKDGKCDALGCLRVKLSKVTVEDLGQFPLVHRAPPTARGRADDAAKPSRRNDATWASTRGDVTKVSGRNDGAPIDPLDKDPSIETASKPGSSLKPPGSPDTKKTRYTDSVDWMTSQLEGLPFEPDATLLDLPVVVAEYKKKSGDLAKATNQLRRYLTASVKFLQTVGIANFPVYGVEADGPVVSLPVAVLRDDDNIVHLFERLVERPDISTPSGAWHYATVLCRLAKVHAGLLWEEFEMVKENLITSLRNNGKDMEKWTVTHQLTTLAAENKVKILPKTSQTGEVK